MKIYSNIKQSKLRKIELERYHKEKKWNINLSSLKKITAISSWKHCTGSVQIRKSWTALNVVSTQTFGPMGTPYIQLTLSSFFGPYEAKEKLTQLYFYEKGERVQLSFWPIEMVREGFIAYPCL